MDEDGEPMPSRSSSSRLTNKLFAEYEAFAERDRSDYDIVYLFVDSVYNIETKNAELAIRAFSEVQ